MKKILLWVPHTPMIIIRSVFGLVIFLFWLVFGPSKDEPPEDKWALTLSWGKTDLLGFESTVTYKWPTMWYFILYGFHEFYRKESHDT